MVVPTLDGIRRPDAEVVVQESKVREILMDKSNLESLVKQQVIYCCKYFIPWSFDYIIKPGFESACSIKGMMKRDNGI